MNQDFFSTLERCGGYYECPREVGTGRRLGPLVGYAQRDEQGGQYVGDIYADCSVLEGFPRELRRFAVELRRQIVVYASEHEDAFALPDAIVALPFGGLSIGLMLAEALDQTPSSCRYLFPEIDLALSTVPGQKPEKKLVFGRHEPELGWKVILAEDVCNAFSTTAQTIELVESRGARVVGIACLLNRSPKFERMFPLADGRVLPIFAAAQRALPSYRQSDQEVCEEVRAGNVVWKPKHERAKLREAMQAATLR